MATIRPRGAKGVYHALWHESCPLPDGRRRSKLKQKSTGTTDKRIAQDIADKLEKESRRPEAEMTMQQMRSAMAAIYLRMKKKDAVLQMTAREFGERWMRSKIADGVEKSSMAFYKAVMKSFGRFLDERGRGGCQIYELTPGEITDYRDAMAQLLSPSTVNHHLVALRGLFKAAREEGWTPDNAATCVKMLKLRRRDSQKARPMSLAQVKQVMAVCDDEWKSMVMFAFYTGKRLIDIATLRESQFNLVKRTIHWNIQKTDSVETSVIHSGLADELLKREWSDGDRPLHPKAYKAVTTTKSVSRSMPLSKQFAKILVKAGLRKSKEPREESEETAPVSPVVPQNRRRARDPLSFHSLRHTLTTNLAALGVDKRVSMEIVGHDNEEIHDGYTFMPIEMMREAIERLPNLFEALPEVTEIDPDAVDA